MNQPCDITVAVIEFLTQPGSDFGTQPHDIEALRSVEALAGEVRLRLETLPELETLPDAAIARETTQSANSNISLTGKDIVDRQRLHRCLREGDFQAVNWPHVMQELRIRLRLADGFFAQDLPSPHE